MTSLLSVVVKLLDISTMARQQRQEDATFLECTHCFFQILSLTLHDGLDFWGNDLIHPLQWTAPVCHVFKSDPPCFHFKLMSAARKMVLELPKSLALLSRINRVVWSVSWPKTWDWILKSEDALQNPVEVKQLTEEQKQAIANCTSASEIDVKDLWFETESLWTVTQHLFD